MNSWINFDESYLKMCRQHSNERKALYTREIEELQSMFLRHFQELAWLRSNNSDIVAIAKALCLQIIEIREFHAKKESRRIELNCKQTEEVKRMEWSKNESVAMNQDANLK